MTQSKQGVPIMLTVPKEIRDRLREMAAQENLKNPDKVTSAAEIGKKILISYLEKNLSNNKT